MRVTAVRGPLAPQRRLHCVGLHAVALHVAAGECFLGPSFRGVFLVDDLAQKGHPVHSVLLHALALQVALCDINQRQTIALLDGLLRGRHDWMPVG